MENNRISRKLNYDDNNCSSYNDEGENLENITSVCSIGIGIKDTIFTNDTTIANTCTATVNTPAATTATAAADAADTAAPPSGCGSSDNNYNTINSIDSEFGKNDRHAVDSKYDIGFENQNIAHVSGDGSVNDRFAKNKKDSIESSNEDFLNYETSLKVYILKEIFDLDCSQKVVFIEPFVHDSHVLQLSACNALSTLQLWGKPFDTRKGVNSNILEDCESGGTKLFTDNIDEIVRFDGGKGESINSQQKSTTTLENESCLVRENTSAAVTDNNSSCIGSRNTTTRPTGNNSNSNNATANTDNVDSNTVSANIKKVIYNKRVREILQNDEDFAEKIESQLKHHPRNSMFSPNIRPETLVEWILRNTVGVPILASTNYTELFSGINSDKKFLDYVVFTGRENNNNKLTNYRRCEKNIEDSKSNSGEDRKYHRDICCCAPSSCRKNDNNYYLPSSQVSDDKGDYEFRKGYSGSEFERYDPSCDKCIEKPLFITSDNKIACGNHVKCFSNFEGVRVYMPIMISVHCSFQRLVVSMYDFPEPFIQRLDGNDSVSRKFFNVYNDNMKNRNPVTWTVLNKIAHKKKIERCTRVDLLNAVHKLNAVNKKNCGHNIDEYKNGAMVTVTTARCIIRSIWRNSSQADKRNLLVPFTECMEDCPVEWDRYHDSRKKVKYLNNSSTRSLPPDNEEVENAVGAEECRLNIP